MDHIGMWELFLVANGLLLVGNVCGWFVNMYLVKRLRQLTDGLDLGAAPAVAAARSSGYRR
jgi:hypothetical protein